jgi:DNA polymerase-1
MENNLTLDFETKDERLNNNKGLGWAYGEVQVLCCGVKVNNGPTKVLDIERDGIEELKQLVQKSHTLIAHNLQYELGILECLGIDYTGKVLYDTIIGSRLAKNTRLRHDLDSLAKEYLNDTKSCSEMEQVAEKLGIVKNKTQNKVNLVKKNMDLLYYYDKSIMFKYCKQDVELCYKLHQIFLSSIPKVLYQKYSRLCEVCVKMQKQGIKIDIKKAKETKVILENKQLKVLEELYTAAGKEFNINSPKQRIEVFEELGLLVPHKLRPNGSYSKSCDEKWMRTQTHKACKLTIEAMRLDKICSMFIDGTLEFADKNGIIHPSMNILQAVTGRFSSSSPNIQQIPARDPELSKLVRDIFVPFDGDNWYSMDFSAQEPRLLSHYSIAINKLHKQNNKAINALEAEYKKNPRMDFHQFAVDIINSTGDTNVTRTEGKTVTLGILYGMGVGKLAQQLEIDVQTCRKIKKAYNKGMPFIRHTDNFVKKAMKQRGYIKTIGGRTCLREQKEYVALNRLIQGGCADMTIEAMLRIYDKGIIPLCVIHDEINISSKDIKEAEIVKDIMETCLTLEVPLVTDIGEGKSWAKAK